MYSVGMANKMTTIHKKNFIFLLLMIPSGLIAADMNHALSGQITDDSWTKETPDQQAPFLKDNVEENISFDQDTNEPSYAIGGIKTEEGQEQFKDEESDPFTQYIPNTSKHTHYFEPNDIKRFEEIAQQGDQGMRMYYINDAYKYDVQNDSFNKIFDTTETTKSKKGIFMIEKYRYLKKGRINIFWSLQAGVGKNTNYGLFKDGKRNNSHFTLWTLPLGSSLGLSIPGSSLGPSLPLKLLHITVLSGPSALGLIQHRRDKEYGHADREKRQYGLGYFAESKFSISLGTLISRTVVRLFAIQKITNIYLDFVVRYHKYSKFRDEGLQVSGQSYGAGLSFEYL